MSALGGKVDIRWLPPKSPLLANSGHSGICHARPLSDRSERFGAVRCGCHLNTHWTNEGLKDDRLNDPVAVQALLLCIDL